MKKTVLKYVNLVFGLTLYNLILLLPVSPDCQAQETSYVPSARLELCPTFENCGVYLNKTQIEKGQDLKAELFFRAKGENDWRPALPMAYLADEEAWRGSIFFLKENTPYEVKIILTGTEKTDTVSGDFITKNSQVPIKKVITLNASNFKSPLVIKESGTADGYIKYVAEKDFILTGEPDSFAVIMTENAKYLVFENLTIHGNKAKTGFLLANSEYIHILNCDISGFGLLGSRGKLNQWGQYGQYYWTDGKMINHNGGIFINKSGNILIERCYIHDPASTANSWFHAHPAGPEAIVVYSTGGTVIRYNDFVGSDNHRWNDTIEGVGNGDINGGFYRDADVYGNLLAFSNDDAIEIEGGEMNIRLYLNRFEGFYCGVSTGSCRLGPSYQFRNLFVNPGDELGRFAVPQKNGHGTPGKGAVYILNNTIAPAGYSMWFGSFGKTLPEKPLKAVTRNNLIGVDKAFTEISVYNHRIDFDYDGYWSNDAATMARVKESLKSQSQEANAVFEKPKFISPVNGDFRLASDSPGRNSGIHLPNLFPTGHKPHMGAFQDDGIEALPYRPIPFHTDKQELRFSHDNLSQKFTVKVKGENFSSPFKIQKNNAFNWFEVSPSEGVLKSGEEISFTVALLPEKMTGANLYRGMLLLRLPSGFSRPVSIYADFRNCPRRLAEEHAKIVFLKGQTVPGQSGEIEFEVKTEGYYFLFAKAFIPGMQTIVVSIGDIKYEKARLFQNTELKWESVCAYKGTPNSTHFYLTPGKHTLKFTLGNHSTIEEFALVSDPKLIIK